MMKSPKSPEATFQPQGKKWVLSETAQPPDAAQPELFTHNFQAAVRTAPCLVYTILSCCFSTGSSAHNAVKVAEFLCLAYHRKSSTSLFWSFFILFCFETRFHCVAQSQNSPASISWVLGYRKVPFCLALWGFCMESFIPLLGMCSP